MTKFIENIMEIAIELKLIYILLKDLKNTENDPKITARKSQAPYSQPHNLKKLPQFAFLKQLTQVAVLHETTV